MILTEQALNEFEALLRKDYPDTDFTPEEIRDIATRVVRLVELICRPIPNEKLDQFKRVNGLPPYHAISEEIMAAG